MLLTVITLLMIKFILATSMEAENPIVYDQLSSPREGNNLIGDHRVLSRAQIAKILETAAAIADQQLNSLHGNELITPNDNVRLVNQDHQDGSRYRLFMGQTKKKMDENAYKDMFLGMRG